MRQLVSPHLRRRPAFIAFGWAPRDEHSPDGHGSERIRMLLSEP